MKTVTGDLSRRQQTRLVNTSTIVVTCRPYNKKTRRARFFLCFVAAARCGATIARMLTLFVRGAFSAIDAAAVTCAHASVARSWPRFRKQAVEARERVISLMSPPKSRLFCVAWLLVAASLVSMFTDVELRLAAAAADAPPPPPPSSWRVAHRRSRRYEYDLSAVLKDDRDTSAVDRRELGLDSDSQEARAGARRPAKISIIGAVNPQKLPDGLYIPAPAFLRPASAVGKLVAPLPVSASRERQTKRII